MSKNIREININQIKIHDPFWSAMQHRMTDTVIPFQEKVLNDEVPGVEKSHAIENFRIAAGLSEGEFYGMVFQDSDVAKWLEGVAYSLAVKPDNELEARADFYKRNGFETSNAFLEYEGLSFEILYRGDHFDEKAYRDIFHKLQENAYFDFSIKHRRLSDL